MPLTGPDILHLVCGDPPSEVSEPRKSEAGFGEFELLRTTWEAVQKLGARSPGEGSIASIRRDAQAVGTRDEKGPAPRVLEAVLSEARAMSELSALADRMPDLQPSTDAVAFVKEMARRASEGEMVDANAALPLQAAVGEAAIPEEGTPAFAEYQILKQALHATEKVPAPSPRAETILSIEAAASAMHEAETERVAALMRAALGDEEISDDARVEVDALRSTLNTTANAQRSSPSDASIAAVLAEAKRHSRVPVGMLPTTDRPAAKSAESAGRFAFITRAGNGSWQRWAGAAVVLLVATTALYLMRPWSTSTPQDSPVASSHNIESGAAEIAESNPSITPDLSEDSPDTQMQSESDGAAVSPAPQVAATEPARAEPELARAEFDDAIAAAQAPMEEETPTIEAPQEAAISEPVATRQVDNQADADTRERNVSWEAGEDVRALSARLEQLRRQNQGLEWGGPAVALGADDDAVNPDPRVRTVGAGGVRVRDLTNEEPVVE